MEDTKRIDVSLEPLDQFIVIQPVNDETETRSGLILPASAASTAVCRTGIVTAVGSDDRRDFTVIGSNVNLCARLCSLARPREILLAESSYALVKDVVAAERLEPQNVKGFTDPIAVYRIRIQ